MKNYIKLLFLFIVIASALIVIKKNVNNNNAHNLQPTSEIRAYIQDIDSIKNALIHLGATFKSEYAFTDYIYQPKGTTWDLNKEFIRLRVYEKTNWNQKKCVLVHKMKKAQGITGKILIHKEFDEMNQAQQELKDDYSFILSFYRRGWQYSLNGSQIFVEDIENLNPTIEIVASDKDKIDDLFAKLSITNVIEYSVPYLIQEEKLKTSDPIHKKLIHELGSFQGQSILDYGCGNGGLIELLLHQETKPALIYGIDVNVDAIKSLEFKYQEQIKNGQLILQVISDPGQLTGKKFDKIVCHNVLECIDNKELFVQSLYQLLNPNGILLISHHDFDSAIYNSNYRDLTRCLIHDFSDSGEAWQTICDGQIGRKIPGIFKRANVEHFSIETVRIVETTFAENDYGYLVAKVLLENAKNKYESTVLNSWMKDLESKPQSNDFYFAIDLMIAKASK